MIQLKYKFYEKIIYVLLKKIIGIENGNFFLIVGVVVFDEICEFVYLVGIDMLVGYGLIEFMVIVLCILKMGYDIGLVGQVMLEVEVKIGEDNEILFCGKIIMKGYYKKVEVMVVVIDEEGWFYIGDVGYFKNGQLYLIECIKDLFKILNGKYIVFQVLEIKLVIDCYIDQIVIIVDQCKFVFVLIVLVYGFVKQYVKEKGIEYKDMVELLEYFKIIVLFCVCIDMLQQQFVYYEQIK